MPRKANRGNDPLLETKWWRVVIRRHWQKQRLPCARCHVMIDYDGPRYIPNRRPLKVNPRSLVVGHVVERHKARLLGWTDAQIMALQNTQPECARCSAKSGARYGNQLRSPVQQTVTMRRDDW